MFPWTNLGATDPGIRQVLIRASRDFSHQLASAPHVERIGFVGKILNGNHGFFVHQISCFFTIPMSVWFSCFAIHFCGAFKDIHIFSDKPGLIKTEVFFEGLEPIEGRPFSQLSVTNSPYLRAPEHLRVYWDYCSNIISLYQNISGTTSTPFKKPQKNTNSLNGGFQLCPSKLFGTLLPTQGQLSRNRPHHHRRRRSIQHSPSRQRPARAPSGSHRRSHWSHRMGVRSAQRPPAATLGWGVFMSYVGC